MVTAHGASEMAVQRARAHGLDVMEATCPLVHYAHRAVKRLVTEGYHPVIVGQRGHVEVRGLTGDLAEFDVVENEAEMWSLRERPRFGVAAFAPSTAGRSRHSRALDATGTLEGLDWRAVLRSRTRVL